VKKYFNIGVLDLLHNLDDHLTDEYIVHKVTEIKSALCEHLNITPHFPQRKCKPVQYNHQIERITGHKQKRDIKQQTLSKSFTNSMEDVIDKLIEYADEIEQIPDLILVDRKIVYFNNFVSIKWSESYMFECFKIHEMGRILWYRNTLYKSEIEKIFAKLELYRDEIKQTHDLILIHQKNKKCL
jgi:hypothetical protein